MATSYANPGGTGNRTASITVTASPALNAGTPSAFVNGNTTETVVWASGAITITFQFATPKVIDEAKFYQSNTVAHPGLFKWQGSNNGSAWTDIGGTFTLGGATVQTQTTLAGNTTGYTYYRLTPTTGTLSSSPWLQEFEFKIDDAAASGPTLVASVSASPGDTGGTSSAIDTTGATLLVVSVSWYFTGTPTLTDSKGNTWTPLTVHGASFLHRFFYALSPVVGAGHTFTVTAGSAFYPAFFAYAFAGVGSYQVESGATSSGSPIATGSVTPAADGALVVTALAGQSTTCSVAPAGFTLAHIPNGASNIQGAAAYQVQTTAAAINPTWTYGGGPAVGVSTAVFLAGTPPTSARVTQAAIETLSLPTPDARVTQAVIEVLGTAASVIVPTEARVSQAVVELLASAAVPVPVRATHLAVEAFVARPAPVVRATQVVVEAFFPLVVPVRTTQQVVETFWTRPARTQATQAIVEVWWVPTCGEVYPKLPLCGTGEWPRLPGPSVADYPMLPPEECMDASTFVTNMALQEIGISKAIGSLLDDQSQEAYCARLIFTDVVDTVLRDHPWKFATEYAALTWLAGTVALPVNPDWTYTYNLPADCVRVRRVCEPVRRREYSVTPIPFDQRADPDGIKDILMCNEPGGGQLEAVDPPTITIEYTKRFACPGQVNDAQFRECLVMKMAARLAKALARDSKDADRALRNYTLALPKAQTQHANSQEPQRPIDAPPDWLRGR